MATLNNASPAYLAFILLHNSVSVIGGPSVLLAGRGSLLFCASLWRVRIFYLPSLDVNQSWVWVAFFFFVLFLREPKFQLPKRLLHILKWFLFLFVKLCKKKKKKKSEPRSLKRRQLIVFWPLMTIWFTGPHWVTLTVADVNPSANPSAPPAPFFLKEEWVLSFAMCTVRRRAWV